MALRETLQRKRHKIALYFGMLMLSLGLADPLGLVNLPIMYLLKDKLELRPPAVATFEAITLLPVYFGFLFGFLRDNWRPFGGDDRRYLLLAAPLGIGGYLWLATHPVNYNGLLIVTLLIMVAFQLMDTATEALVTMVGQRERMTGRLSALSELADVVPNAVAVLLGGWLAAHTSTPLIFFTAAVITLAIPLQALWRPKAIFGPSDHFNNAVDEFDRTTAFGRLLRHRPLWPTMGILAFWNFAPGWGTPFLYYLSEEIDLSSEVFGMCRAVNLVFTALAAFIYGILCCRHSLKRMLWWGVSINVFPGALYLLIGNASQAVVVSAVVGLVFGMTNIALFDLLRRSCPKDLEGTGIMLGFSALTGAGTLSDLLGSYFYDQGGFVLCLALDALATLCVFPLLRRVPFDVIADTDRDYDELVPRTGMGTP